MRGIGNHTPPDEMQPAPNDNTGNWIVNQVDVWRRTGLLVHTESAREIAAWWQSPGRDGIRFGEFASTGTLRPELADDIRSELRITLSLGDVDSLNALLAYVQAAAVEEG